MRDAHRLNPVADHGRGDVAQVAEELFEPELQVQPVPQDQVGILRFENIARCRLVIVDFCTRLGDAVHDGHIARDVAGHIGDDGEGCDGFELVFRLGRHDRGQGGRNQGRKKESAHF